MDRFWDLMEKSVIVQAGLSFSLVGAMIFLLVQGKPIPDTLTMMTGTVLGFWFGTKAQQLAHKKAK